MNKPETVGQLCELYYQKHILVNTKCHENYKWWAKVHGPRWFSVPIAEVTRASVQEWVDDYGIKSKSAANRAVNQLASVLTWGIRKEYCSEPNPCRWVDKFRSRARDRFLQQEELERLTEALEQESETLRDFFWMLLLTGARKGNVMSMRWDELNIPLAMWRIPADKFKNGETHNVVLGAPALEILERRKISKSGPWVFSGRKADESLKDPKRPWSRVLKRAKLSNLRIHDLRRTVGSYMAISGCSLPIIGKALGHRDQRSTQIYARLDLSSVRTAYDAVFKMYDKGLPAPQQPKPPALSLVPALQAIQPEAALPEKSAVGCRPLSRFNPTQRLIIEGKIITSIQARHNNKKAFFKRLGAIKAKELDEILKGMEERGLICSIPDRLLHNVCRYSLCEGSLEASKILSITKGKRTVSQPKKAGQV